MQRLRPTLNRLNFARNFDYYSQFSNVGSSANNRDNIEAQPSAFNQQYQATPRSLGQDFIAEANGQEPQVDNLNGTRGASTPQVNQLQHRQDFSNRPAITTPSGLTYDPSIDNPEAREAWRRSFTPSYHEDDRTAHLKWQNGDAAGVNDQSLANDYQMRRDERNTRNTEDEFHSNVQVPVGGGGHQNNRIGPGTNLMSQFEESTENGVHTPFQPDAGQDRNAMDAFRTPPINPTNYSGTGTHPGTTGPSGASIQVDGSWGYDMVYQQAPTLSSIPPAADIPVQEWGPARMGITTPAHYAYHNTNHRHAQISFA